MPDNANNMPLSIKSEIATAPPRKARPEIGRDGRVVEGIVTTLDSDGAVHCAPMGPIVGERFDRLILRPFASSETCQNLLRTGQGVFHVVDDVMLVAQSAIGSLKSLPETQPVCSVAGAALTEACRWFAFEVVACDDSNERNEMLANVVEQRERRPFFGFNRAMHAVIEAAILATRVELLEIEFLGREFQRLHVPVIKTGSHRELQAFQLLAEYMRSKLGDQFATNAKYDSTDS